VRTAHYWTRLHPDLALEEDAIFLLDTHQRLRQCLLGAPAAGRAPATQATQAAKATTQPLPAALAWERETPAADDDRENERRRQQELADSRLLHDISIELIGEQDIALLYGKITSAAARLMDAPCATMQMLCEEQDGTAELQLLGHHGIPPETAAAWQRVSPGGGSVCATALARNERVVVPDIDQFGLVADAEALVSFRHARIRAVQSTPLKSRAGTVVGMISTHWQVPHMPSARELHLLDILARQAADLIERAKAEQALRESEERLRESDRMKDQFLAILAHELRNPLTPICNSLELLRLSDMAADTGRLLGMLDRQVNHIVHLVDDLLETSRISRGEIQLKRELLELADVLHTAIDASKSLIENGGHRLELQVPENPVRVHGDAVRLTQVFTNLLNNAAKYTPAGGRIALSVQPEGEQVAVSVCDNGIGIAPDQLPRLFQMFVRLNPGSGHPQGGLGIGLSLAQRLAQMHGGGIEAHSAGLGQGSRFTVRLPLASYSPPPASPDHSIAAAGLHRLRILIVDDNRDAGDSLAMLLRLLGAEVRAECDGAAALAVLDAYRPSAVLLDLGMPGMDGYEVARRIRADDRHGDVMLVAITGWSQQQDRERARAAGFHHHLIKPLDTGRLVALLAATSAA